MRATKSKRLPLLIVFFNPRASFARWLSAATTFSSGKTFRSLSSFDTEICRPFVTIRFT